MHRIHRHVLFAVFALGTAAYAAAGMPSQDPPEKEEQEKDEKERPQDGANYVGARVCRNCHRTDAKGNQYRHWGTQTPHVDAFATLGNEQSREIADERGIEDPQKAPECLKCHVTAHGVEEKRIEKTFHPVRHRWGVQCESCHGPGSAHVKLRTRAAAKQKQPEPGKVVTLDIPPGEISIPVEETCRGCHNPESPTYKPYDHDIFLPKVAHPNPMRKRNQKPPEGKEGGEDEEEESDSGGESRTR